MQIKNSDNKHVMVIDDEPDVREVIQDYLEGKGFRVSVAEDGLKALELMEKEIPDAAIIDLLLPGEHGINLVKTIKEKYFIPIIMISSIYRMDEVQHIIDEYFVEGFMEKPLDLKQLEERLHRVIDA